MLIQLDPDRMAQLGITVSDVAAAVREQNATNPAGPARRGSRRRRAPSSRCRSRRSAGSRRPSSSPTSSSARGPTARSSGCATSARWCSARGTTISPAGSTAGPTAPLLLYLRPGANALAVKQAVVKRMNELARSFPPGVQYTIPFDTTPFVTASIKEVVTTLVEAMAARDAGGLHLPPELARDAHPDARRAGQRHRHVPRPAAARLLDQRADAVRAGARDRHRGGRRDRRDRERRAHHGRRGPVRRASPPTARSGRWPARWSRSCSCSARCSCRWRSSAA